MNARKGFSSCTRLFLFLMKDHTLWAWGDNEFGGLGFPSKICPHPPKQLLPSVSDIVNLAAGQDHVLVLTATGQVLAWGRNHTNQLGLGYESDPVLPTVLEFPGQPKITRVYAGGEHSAASTEDGRLFTWGDDIFHQLGHGTCDVTSPRHVLLPSRVVDVACGWYHFVVLTEADGVYVWGRNSEYELGLDDKTPRDFPVELPYFADIPVVRVFAGGSRSMVLAKNGSLYSWGWNYQGGTGLGVDGEHVKTPKLLFSRQDISEIACGPLHTIVLLKDESLLVWGKNMYGQLGLGHQSSCYVPTRLTCFSERIAAIGASSYSWAITNSGDLYTWGIMESDGARVVPTRCLPLRKLHVPLDLWDIFKWIFLGRGEEGSSFEGFPVEIIFNCLLVIKSI